MNKHKHMKRAAFPFAVAALAFAMCKAVEAGPGAIAQALYQAFGGTPPNAAGTNGQALTSSGPGADPTYTTLPGSGTVTSVGVSGGSTGLSFAPQVSIFSIFSYPRFQCRRLLRCQLRIF